MYNDLSLGDSGGLAAIRRLTGLVVVDNNISIILVPDFNPELVDIAAAVNFLTF